MIGSKLAMKLQNVTFAAWTLNKICAIIIEIVFLKYYLVGGKKVNSLSESANDSEL